MCKCNKRHFALICAQATEKSNPLSKTYAFAHTHSPITNQWHQSNVFLPCVLLFVVVDFPFVLSVCSLKIRLSWHRFCVRVKKVQNFKSHTYGQSPIYWHQTFMQTPIDCVHTTNIAVRYLFFFFYFFLFLSRLICFPLTCSRFGAIFSCSLYAQTILMKCFIFVVWFLMTWCHLRQNQSSA